MPHHRITLLSIISILIITLFLLGIFGMNYLFSSLNQTSTTTNTSLPSSMFNSTPHNTTINTPKSKPESKPEPTPSFTGAIIVGVTRPVTILGKEGFSSSDVSIKAGDSITWKNADPQQKKVVLIFQQGRERNQFFNSPVILPDDEWESVFWDEGEYNYWTTAYGVEGKVIVTPCKNRFCPRKE